MKKVLMIVLLGTAMLFADDTRAIRQATEQYIRANYAVIHEQRDHEKKHTHLVRVADEKREAFEAECQRQSKDKHAGFDQVELKVGCVVWMGQPLNPSNTTTNR